jgi:non-histone protein 10
MMKTKGSSSPGGFVPPIQDKYKKKLKDLKKRNREIEDENDRLVLKISRARRDVERLRAERSFLFQKLDDFEKISRGEDIGENEATTGSGLRGRRDEYQDEDDREILDVEGTFSKSKDPSAKKSGLTLTLPSIGSAPGSSSSSSSAPAAAAKKPEKDPNAPKKHLNAFKVYCQIERARDRERFSKMSLSDQTRALGAAWKLLTPEEKKVCEHFFLAERIDSFLRLLKIVFNAALCGTIGEG